MASRIGVGVLGCVLVGWACASRADVVIAPCDRSPPAMRCLAGGPRMIGDDADPVAKPRQDVTLSTFWIDEAPVTSAGYAACVEDGACKSVPGLPKAAAA